MKNVVGSPLFRRNGVTGVTTEIETYMSSFPSKIVTALEGIRLNVLGINMNIRLTGEETVIVCPFWFESAKNMC